jgi:cytidylate kinase
MVVTITRQYGAGGSRIAQLVAQALGWTVIDNEFVAAVAAAAGLPIETVAAHEERAPSLMERLVRTLATASPEVFVPAGSTDEEPTEARIVKVTARVIAEAAQHGRVVLVGRGAQAVLASAGPAEALHVWVVAPRAARLTTLMTRLGVDEEAAADAMDDTEAQRDRYVHKWHGRQRQDPANYHIAVNTGFLGYEGAAELVVSAARQRGWGGRQ